MLARYGISYDEPTVRDAVAFDLVKLDSDSVSNDSTYTFDEHGSYSTWELERFLLHRNFRINLVNLEPEWSAITYGGKSNDSENVKVKRTVDRVYQGIRLSTTLMSYFNRVFNAYIGEDGKKNPGFNLSDIYVPFTNANDFYA